MSAKRYLEPAFIRELRTKAVGYYIGADQYKSSAGKTFPKDLPQDPCFQAIACIRRRGAAEQKLKRDFAPAEDQEFERFSIRNFFVSNELTPKGIIHILDELYPRDPAAEQLLAAKCIDAIRNGRLQDIAKLAELYERQTFGRLSQQPERTRDLVPWHYYFAMAAYGFLKLGTDTTRKGVEEAALQERAIDELSAKPKPKAGRHKKMRIDPEPVADPELDQDQDALRQRLKEIDLDLSDHYGADQGQTDGPTGAIPTKSDLLAEERLRILQLLRERITQLLPERITQWQREAQAESRKAELRTEEVKKPTEKSRLMKEHEKQIGEKMKELRRYLPKNRRRIFKDLGLDQLQ